MKIIQWRPSALADLENIHAYVSEHNPTAANNLIRHIRNNAERASLFPRSGRKGQTPNSYELVVTRYPFLIVYEICDQIEVVAVFHTAQNPDKK